MGLLCACGVRLVWTCVLLGARRNLRWTFLLSCVNSLITAALFDLKEELGPLSSLANKKQEDDGYKVSKEVIGGAHDVPLVYPAYRLHLIRIASNHETDTSDNHP